MTMTLRSLSEASNARYEPGTYDLRDWEVRVRPGDDRIGIIDDVLVDDRGRTCYLDVALESTDRHVLVPSGQAEAEENDRIVWLSGLRLDRLSDLPEYHHDPSSIDPAYERELVSAWDRSLAGGDYYDRPDYTASWGRGRRTESGGTLQRLDRLDDIEVAKGDPDPRGWGVVGEGDEELGTVRHLIGDLDRMVVRYVSVAVDDDLERDGREVLVPVGHVELDPDRKRVRIPALDRSTLANLPRYAGEEITRERETELTEAFADAYSEERRYDHPRYRYNRLYRSEGTSGPAPFGDEEQSAQAGLVVRRWHFASRDDLPLGGPSTRSLNEPESSPRREPVRSSVEVPVTDASQRRDEGTGGMERPRSRKRGPSRGSR